MIFISIFSYFLFSFYISFLIRKFFRNEFFKSIFFSLSISLFLTFWFTYPGSKNLSPIISIFIMDLFEANSFGLLRILRPFLVCFVFFLVMDLTRMKITRN